MENYEPEDEPTFEEFLTKLTKDAARILLWILILCLFVAITHELLKAHV